MAVLGSKTCVGGWIGAFIRVFAFVGIFTTFLVGVGEAIGFDGVMRLWVVIWFMGVLVFNFHR